MADLQHKIDALNEAAIAGAPDAVAPVLRFVETVLDGISDLSQFTDALITAIRKFPDSAAEGFQTVLESLLLASNLTGRAAVHRSGASTVALADTGFDRLPFVEAINAARDRIVLPRPAFDQLSTEMKSRAFTVAWQSSMQVLSDIHTAHVRTLETGGTSRDFRQALPQMAEEAGWGGDRPWHADLVFRQQSQMAYGAGRFQQMTDAGVGRWQYSALLDSRTRPTHAALDGKVFRMSDRKFYPPWDYNCRCTAEPVFDDELPGQATDSANLQGRQFGTDPTSGEPLVFPSATAQGGPRFQWDPASFSRVAPLKLSSIAPALRTVILTLLADKQIPVVDDTIDNAGELPLSEERMMNMKQLILFVDGNIQSAPSRFLLMPWGTVETRKGTYVLDDIAARNVVAEFRRGGVDVVIDRDHQTLGGKFSAPDGNAPAMGWIRDLEVVKGEGIYALTDWTQQGRDALQSRSYRYHSPVLDVNNEDLRVTRVKCVALTNMPATLNTPSLVNKDDVSDDAGRSGASGASDNTEAHMSKEVNRVLALKEDASETDQLAAIQALNQKVTAGETAQSTLKLVCSELGVAEDADATKITGAVLKLKGSDQAVKVLSEEVKTLRETVAGQEADKLITAAEKSGKLTEAMKAWARKLILSDRQAFEDWEKTAPVVRPQTRTEAPAGETKTGESRDRKSLILSAREEFDSLKHVVDSERIHVNGSLIAAGLSPLTDAEATEHKIA